MMVVRLLTNSRMEHGVRYDEFTSHLFSLVWNMVSSILYIHINFCVRSLEMFYHTFYVRAVNGENRRSCERSRPLRSSNIRESFATTSRGSRVRHQAGRSSTTNTTTTCSQRWGARLSRTHRPQGSDVYWIHPATPVQSLCTPSATQGFRPVSAYPPAANANWRPQTIRCSVNRVIRTRTSVRRYLAETLWTWRTRSTSSFKIRRRWSVKETAIVTRGWRRLMNSVRQTITAVQGVLIEQAQVVMRRRHYPGGKVTLERSSGVATSNVPPRARRVCCSTYRCSCVSGKVWEIGCGQTRSIVTASTCWTSLIRSSLPSTTSMNVASCTVISRYRICFMCVFCDLSSNTESLPVSVGFLPGRKVFLPHEGEKKGRKYFCHSFCHFCRGERAELIKTW